MGIKVREFMEQPRTVKHIVLKVIWFSDSKVMFKIFLPGSKSKEGFNFLALLPKIDSKSGNLVSSPCPFVGKKKTINQSDRWFTL